MLKAKPRRVMPRCFRFRSMNVPNVIVSSISSPLVHILRTVILLYFGEHLFVKKNYQKILQENALAAWNFSILPRRCIL